MRSYERPEDQSQERQILSMESGNRMSARSVDTPWSLASIVFLSLRVFLSLWAILVLWQRPIPSDPDPVIYPYLGERPVQSGVAGALLGPWQRFDTMHFVRIAREGYEAVEDSVFPPLYPLLMRAVGAPLQIWLPAGQAYLLAGIIISNLSFVMALALFYQLAVEEIGRKAARRGLVYLALFPTSFYFLAAYTESLFLLLVLGAFWMGRRGRFWAAGVLGLLSSLTRLTGWSLTFVLAYLIWQQHRKVDEDSGERWRILVDGTAALLPAAGAVAFLAWRELARLPSLADVYRRFWLQTVGFPGGDTLIVLQKIGAGEAAFSRTFDLFVALFLLAMTVWAFRRLGTVYGLYSTLMLLFIYLPTSVDKPLFSFSRYALVFFPVFMLLGTAGRSPWLNRLILYPSVGLFLYFAGQFFMWGWVA